jgi:uncharacterized protein YbjT (DUF2867 family)
MASQKIFITGANGNVGTSTIDHLHKNFPQVKVVAGVRDASKATKLGEAVELAIVGDVVADKSAFDDLVKSMSGCDAALIIPPNAGRFDIVKAYIDAAKAAGVKFLAMITGTSIGLSDCQLARKYTEFEQYLESTGIRHCSLRCDMFMSNHLVDVKTVKRDRAFYYPVNPEAKFTPVAVSDIGAVAATVMVNSFIQDVQEVYVLSPATVTMSELARIYSDVSKTEVKYVQTKRSDTKNILLGFGIPEWYIEAILEIWDMVNEGKYEISRDDVEKVLGRKPLTFREFITAHEAVFQ